MINHAIFTGLVVQRATPITDDPFHSAVLAHKINRSSTVPQVRQLIEEPARHVTR